MRPSSWLAWSLSVQAIRLIGLPGIALYPLTFIGLAVAADCRATRTLPIGIATQGGYRFEYESGHSAHCRVYRVRNTSGKVLTPVLRRDDRETFLDVDIPACPATASCRWIDSRIIGASPPLTDKSKLGYGINKDEYHDEPDAFLSITTSRTPFK